MMLRTVLTRIAVKREGGGKGVLTPRRSTSRVGRGEGYFSVYELLQLPVSVAKIWRSSRSKVFVRYYRLTRALGRVCTHPEVHRTNVGSAFRESSYNGDELRQCGIQ